MKNLFLVLMLIVPAMSTVAMVEDDPLTARFMLDELEVRPADGPDPRVLDAEAWIGYDLDKIRFRAEAEHVDGATEEAELQLLYSRAVTPFWDAYAGWRRDLEPGPERDFLAMGFVGVAPYMVETDAALFIGESGQAGVRLDVEYEYLLTQKWVLSPEAEVNLYSRDDETAGIGSGLSDLELGVRLRYEIRRELAPYVGVTWSRKFGATRDFAAAEGEDADDVRIVAGVRAWF